jgi:hypothetical protein
VVLAAVAEMETGARERGAYRYRQRNSIEFRSADDMRPVRISAATSAASPRTAANNFGRPDVVGTHRNRSTLG